MAKVEKIWKGNQQEKLKADLKQSNLTQRPTIKFNNMI